MMYLDKTRWLISADSSDKEPAWRDGGAGKIEEWTRREQKTTQPTGLATAPTDTPVYQFLVVF
ncbi:MAG: hypothetical protein ACK5RG_18690 [Cyclobacteriaceae bacterium]|jgi:hypothetical protein|nr:hypothetical protein [Flammeovirgaceae bacterium]